MAYDCSVSGPAIHYRISAIHPNLAAFPVKFHFFTAQFPNLSRPKDKLFRTFIVLFPVSIAIYINDVFVNPNLVLIGKFIVTLISTILICEGARILIYNSRKWFPRQRILFTLLSGLAFTTIVLTAGVLIRHYLSNGTWETLVMVDSHFFINGNKVVIGLLGNSFLTAIFIFPFLLAGFEIIYHSWLVNSAKRENEKLEKEKLRAELQQLKGIVNPHFLFNNLNSLSSLIAENPKQAQDFLDELTKVFRYLLRNNDTELVTLAQELQFIESYYHLLQTRYGRAVNMKIEIDESQLSKLIPPLTLQLLVENAVKHNTISKTSPLEIEIISEKMDRLLVRNNISSKVGKTESTGIGLQNINARYKMMDQPGPVITKDDRSFSVEIQLIEPTIIPENS